MKNYIKAVFLIVILLFLVTFGIKNNQPLRLNYYFEWHTIDFPLYILAYASIIIGVFIGMLIGINNRFQQRRKIKVLEKLTNELKAKAEKEMKADEIPADQPADEKTLEEEAAERQKENFSEEKASEEKAVENQT
ncbi:MAG: DUF1049 domain-containing protein [Desulfobacterales bacterium]|nr:MAG: DUF1049 domain-containing protein [Desulfobacterales bacterium]